MAKRKPAISLENFIPTHLMNYDACTRCGECVKYCPTYKGRNYDRAIEPRDKIIRWRDWVTKSYGWRAKLLGPAAIPEKEIEKYTEDLYNCTICGMCGTVCPSGLDTIEMWESNRANLVKRGNGPYGKQSLFPKLIGEKHNPYLKEQQDRLAWVTPDIKIAEKSDIAYFAGCTAGYNQHVICVGTARILNRLNIPFMLLVPRLAALHNVEALKTRGAKRVIYSCAGCFRTAMIDWPRAYGKELPFESIHISQFLAEQLEAGKIKWEKSFEKTITFHDPCHLGRHIGIFEEPRKILKSMPGVKLVEMERNRNEQRCCGAGGGVKAGLPDLALNVAKDRMNDALETGAEVLISGCPFCRRNLLDGRDELKLDMKVDDIVVLAAHLMGLSTEINTPPPGAPKEIISDLFRTQSIPGKLVESQREALKAEKE
ncbi:CoB--CoM heterodisulfide reductase iron-sulfur subunit D [uncultured archaeon]|nr:CoB--CoM heterodisulfide reductase iron-sulfur subunit D [uncultured archaeon]